MNAFPPKKAPLEKLTLPPLPERPLVSIIVPSFNQGRYIRETIDSILAQDYRPLQIHVIDGASSDETVSVLESYGDIPELDWVSEPDNGVVDAVNKGFAKAKGEIVAIQSSDDRYLPGALQRIVGEFLGENSSEIGLIYGDTVKVDETGIELQRYRIGPWSLENLLLLKTWIPQPSCFFRRDLLDACGGWDERIPYAPDTDLWIRMAFRTQVRKIDEYLSERRVHDQQRDTQAAKILRDYHAMIKNSPDIAMASKSIKRAAHAGCELLYGRYNPTGSHWNAVAHELRAAVILPKSISWKRVGYNIVISARIVLSPIKRAFFGGFD
jgi:glycosyltransferase involved in cell wall biosynthesis